MDYQPAVPYIVLYRLKIRQKMSSYDQLKLGDPRPRFSILTNIKPVSKPKSQNKISPLLAITMMTICFIVIVFKLFQSVQKAVNNMSPSLGNQESKVVTEIYEIVLINEAQKIYGLPPIPLTEGKNPSCQAKEKKEQHKQSIRNIEIFQLMKDYRTTRSILQKHFVKIQPLYSVKHEKFTSPHISSKRSILSFDYWNPFHDNFETNYIGVDKIFRSYNEQKWQSFGKYLTIVSDQPIKPTLLILTLPESMTQKDIYIYGISVIAETLVNKNTLQSTLIKKTKVKQGYNKIECDQSACVSHYSMIMLLMDPISIIRLELYSSSLRTWINFHDID